ncbi:DUF4336 domain-containing protein [Roseovarius aestuariivivens]|uniref:DUF4336 domain-containing protein n=1 Tax=Roseovarius aestuariivivens TaxID=1888910 RepID=UPI001080F785|nr:DUF4336 domain-containing protein [Roseovarius aestuariivivens]
MTATGYEPLDTLKPVADDLWIIDGAAVRVMGFPFPTRATVVRLRDGGLWVHSPTPLTEGLRREIEAEGPVAHLIAPNQFHFLYLNAWAAAFPEAAVWLSPGARDRAARSGVTLPEGEVLCGAGPETPWAGQIEQLLIKGSRWHKEVVFHHKASATTILTDLIQAFETEKLPARCRPFVWLNGIDDSDGKTPPLIRWSFRDKNAMAGDLETVIGWGARRVILSHGRWYRRDGTAELERAFRRVLGARAWERALAAQKAGEASRR